MMIVTVVFAADPQMVLFFICEFVAVCSGVLTVWQTSEYFLPKIHRLRLKYIGCR